VLGFHNGQNAKALCQSGRDENGCHSGLAAPASAVSFRGHPRATRDLDIVVSADPESAKSVYAALAKFGATFLMM
jgi:hypothetical protein